MQKIDLKAASPGMKLAKAVKNKRGMILCSQGTELTEPTLARLADMEVKQITVEGQPLYMGHSEKNLQQQIDELQLRFRPVEEDPLMRKIRDILLERLKQRGKN
ncbi:MAG: hypothetical protein ACOC6B_05540 [Thermodesulfobacteriota bacterium]